MGRRRAIRFVSATALVLLWSAIAFLALEVRERYLFSRRARHNIFATEEGLRRAELAEGSDSTLWAIPQIRYRPNVEFVDTIRGIPLQIKMSSRGFRTPEVEIPKPPDVFRIVCVGASTTVEGHTNATTYPALLEQELRSRFEGQQIEVVNCGVSAVIAMRELSLLPRYLEYEPDLLLEYNGVNDIKVIMRALLTPANPLEALIRQSRFLTRVFGERFRPTKAELEEKFDGVMSSLERLASNAKSEGVPVLFCTFARPDPTVLTEEEREFFEYNWQTDWYGDFLDFDAYCEIVDLYNAKLSALCMELGSEPIPVAAEMPGQKEYFEDVCHMTPKGIALKSEILARHLTGYLESRFQARESGAVSGARASY